MKTANETLELLSKLLSEEDAPQTPYNVLYEKIFLAVKQDLTEQLNKSSYPEKSILFSELKDFMDSIEVLTQFPEVIGKTIIGIMGTTGKIQDELLEAMAMKQNLKIYKYGNNVPAIIHDDGTENIVKAINHVESPVSVSLKDFRSANKELHKQSIDIRQFLYVFSISARMTYDNIAYISFPFYALKSQDYYINLINLVDRIVVPADGQGKWKNTFEYLKRLKKSCDVCIIAEEEHIQEVTRQVQTLGKNSHVEYTVDVGTLDYFKKWIEPHDIVRNNVAISERFLGIISKFNIYQLQRIEHYRQIIGGMNKDLFNIDDDETESSIRELKIEIDKSLDNAQKNFNDFKGISEKIMDLIEQFENSLYDAASVPREVLTDPKVLFHGDIEHGYVKLIMDLIQIGNFNSAREYISKLEARDYPYIYIFELYMDDKMERMLSSHGLLKLKNDHSDHNLVLKAKVKFGELINLTIDDLGKYAKSIKGPLNGHEYYILGEYYSEINGNTSKMYYRKSLEEGYLNAGDKLMQFDDSKSPFKLEQLAKLLVPEANYLYGIKCLENNKYARGITYLKIAAVFEHSKAIYALANIEYANASRNIGRPNDRTEKSINIAFQLYHYLLDEYPQNTDIMEKLGIIYYWLRDYRRSRNLLEQCDSAEALFICGRMYQYGDGIAQNIYVAKDLFKSAAYKGHTRAKVEYEKVCGWIDSNNAEKLYSNHRDYSTSSSYSHVSSSGGFCFLTTATCFALGKEDDCEELLAFKRYRDEHLIHDDDGAKLIREYYRIAPFILQAIDQEVAPSMIFQKLYEEYIAIGYEYLKRKDYINAKKTYISMVENLCKKYDIDVFIGNRIKS